MSTQTHLTFCKLSPRLSQQLSFSWCKLFSGEVKQNQGGKKKKQNSQPQTHYISSSQSISWHWLHPKDRVEPPQERLLYLNSKPGTNQSLRKISREKCFSKVSTLKNLSPSFESSGGSRPSIVNQRFNIIFKKVHLYALNIIVMRNLFPKIYCSKCNHFWKTQTPVIFLGALQPQSLLKHHDLIFVTSKFLMKSFCFFLLVLIYF